MTLDHKLRTSLFWMIGIGVQVYCIAEANLTLSLITIPIWLLAWPISMSDKGHSIPKFVLGMIALGLTVRVFAAALLSPEDFVAAISRYIVWLQLLKLYDRREPSDIAQAMALMGVRPRWAAGSGRVTGFEVIPASLLDRPRIDVTLRISGFFRDAFFNVVALFDKAVCAVADLDEPEAIEALERVLELDPRDADARRLLSQAR